MQAKREQRRHRRISMVKGAELLVARTDRGMKILINNVSYSGMGLYSPEMLEEGTEVVVRISFSDGQGREVFEVVSGKVRWCRPQIVWFASGIEFQYLAREEHSLLLSFLKRAEQPEP